MVAALLSLNAASFSRSFSDYVVQQETRRLQPLMNNIAEEYQRVGNWQWLRWDNSRWLSVLRQSLGPRELRNMDRLNSSPGNNIRGFLDKLVIRETETNTVLIGRKRIPPNIIWLPIKTDTGEIIAQLGFEADSRLDNQFDELFAKQQTRSLVIIGLFGFVIAAALAIPFSGWLVRPIQRLTGAVGDMTQGDLTVSVDDSRNDELGQLAADFNKLAQVLNQNQRDRQQWVSDISHELRTPVAVLMGDIEAAQDGVRPINEQWLSNMKAHTERLTRLVGDLHQLSQSDSGTLSYQFKPVNLTELLSLALVQFDKSCSDGHIEAQLDAPTAPVFINGDDARLNQLFSNLAQNTLRYTDGDANNKGRLKIQVTEMKEHIRVVWEDSSPGVGLNELNKLFDRLYRVEESRSRESGGSGLGLAIVKNIVEAHHGNIIAQQSELGGVKIIVTFLKESVEK
jgi:two-component system sensor histidine kinase BaeS